MKMKGNKYMPYFHTSSYLKEGQTVSKNTKNNYKTCEFIFSYDVDCYSEYLSLLNELDKKNISRTGRDKYKWACEAIFESVRKKNFADLPSRIWGMYAFGLLENAILFNNSYRKGKANIFEINPSEKVYKFNMSLFTKADDFLRKNDNKSSFNHAKKLAYKYWCQNEPIIEEEFIFEQDEITIGKLVYAHD